MKRRRKYAFIWMLVASSLLYGMGKAVWVKTGKDEVRTESRTMTGNHKKSDGTKQKTAAEPVAKKNKAKENGENPAGKQSESGKKAGEPVQDQQDIKGGKSGGILPDIPEDAGEQSPAEQTKERSFHRVEMDYLKDALFIGDSRTSTLYEYAGWEETDFFVKNGQTIWDVFDNTMEGKSLEGMLSEKQYGKIYIMLGINELGSGTPDSYAEQFRTVVERVRKQQPGAVIFVEAIMHVAASKDAKHTYINNKEINARNERLKGLADQRTVFYIDVNEVMDEPGTGALKEEYSFDGVHLKVKYIDIWREFLLDHGI